MNKQIWIVTLAALSLITSACGKEDPAPVAATPVVEEATTQITEDATTDTPEATTESVVVVEESARKKTFKVTSLNNFI